MRQLEVAVRVDETRQQDARPEVGDGTAGVARVAGAAHPGDAPVLDGDTAVRDRRTGDGQDPAGGENLHPPTTIQSRTRVRSAIT